MEAIDFPEPRFHDVALEPEAIGRQLASSSEVLNEPPLLKRLSLAEPIVVPLSAKKAYSDRQISDFIEKQKNKKQFFLVRLSCSFAPPKDEPINRAWVTVALNAGMNKDDKTTAVISMDPDKMSDTQKVERNVTAKANFKLAGGTAGLELERIVATPEARLFMAALGVGNNQVGWEMYETAAMKIGGIYVFTFIVQSPAKQTTHGIVEMQMEITRKKFGIIPYKSMLAEHPSSKFVCSAAT